MHQNAWLDFYRGKWHLLTGSHTDPVRIWVDKEAALSTLAGEGWEISGPHQNELSGKLGLGDKNQGYVLMRTIPGGADRK